LKERKSMSALLLVLCFLLICMVAFAGNFYKNLNDYKKQNKVLLENIDNLYNDIDTLQETLNKRNEKIEFLKNRIKVLENNLKSVKAKKEEIKYELEKEKEKKVSVNKKDNLTSSDSLGNFTMTHYTSKCSGCTGETASGVDVRSKVTHNGIKVVAVDESIIPLGSILRISDGDITFKAQALDTGGRINGKKLDLLVKNKSKAMNLGVKQVNVDVIRYGW
jgi:3D (Asp-Asp-Asp) domain-containing protein